MRLTQIVNRIATLTLALTFTTPVWALPLTFEFTGTINDTVLISNSYQTIFTLQPEWNGKKVSGTVTMNLDEVASNPYSFNEPTYAQYSGYPYAAWMSFSINNPDGKVLDISNSVPIYPEPEDVANDAYTSLAHNHAVYGYSGFYAQRTYSSYDPYPRNHASLWLSAIGDEANLLTSSANYWDVIIKPEFANSDNWGSVYQLDETGVGYDYLFRIDSLKRVEVAVPEPSGLMLSVIAFLFLGWRVFQASKLKK